MQQKKFFSRLLAIALVMVLTMLPMAVVAQENEPAPIPVARVFEVGPDREFQTLEELRQYVMASGTAGGNFANLQPGSTILVYPNIVDGRNVPHLVPENGRWFINASGTASAPILISGVIDQEGRRPIITSRVDPGQTDGRIMPHSVITIGNSPWEDAYMHSGNHVTVENLIVDGGVFAMFDFFNGVAEEGNRFYNRFGAPEGGNAFSVDVTLENFYTIIHTPFENEWFACEERFGNRRYGAPRVQDYFAGTPYEFMIRNAGANSHGPTLFSNRAILIEGGDNVTVYNTLVMGGGTGVASADGGPGSIVIDRVEAGFNGMHFSGHNLYFNGDMMRHPHLTLTLRNSFIHNAIGTQGFRTRVGRNLVYNNLFLNNGAKQVDLVGFDAGGIPMGIMIPVYAHAQRFLGLEPNENIPHWESSFSLPQDTEFIGNISIYTGPFHNNHVHIGGAGQVWEESQGRYRFLNNTFIHLAGSERPYDTAREAIGARFGIESVELFNNVFYSQHDNFYAFIDEMVEWSEITWAFGERQIQGSNNWMHHNVRLNATRNDEESGSLLDYISDTIFGQEGENPFVNLAGHDLASLLVDPAAFNFSIRPGSSASTTGVPVSTVAEFMTYEEHAIRLAAGLIPEVYDWRFVEGEVISEPAGGWPTAYLPSSDTTSTAPWRGLGFGDPFHDGYWTWQPPIATNTATPPTNFVATAYGFTWAQPRRTDSNQPALGAFLPGTGAVAEDVTPAGLDGPIADVAVRVVNGVEFVGFRAAAYAHGYTLLSWDGVNVVVYDMGDATFDVNRVGGFFDSASSRVYVPLAFVLEFFN